ncbi:MAG TPA: Na-translocating system protein MpsC family protein [Solirubrobacteraceae bacterium]|nr:Na-translocating system protein MpsC family protein [Solirubrobacteraceae bacterium]
MDRPPEDSATSGIPGNAGRLAGGHLLATISTSIVSILREHYGRGPMKAKTYVLDDIVVVVMRGSGFTPLEQTIMDSGEPDRVIAMREDFQRVMAERYREVIHELTGRQVVAFLSQAHVEPDITMEIFFVDGPLAGFGAVEIIEPE